MTGSLFVDTVACGLALLAMGSLGAALWASFNQPTALYRERLFVNGEGNE